METANENILNDQIRHQVVLQRYASGTVRKIITLLDAVNEDVKAQLITRIIKIQEKGVDTGPFTTKRLRDLLIGVNELRAEAYQASHLELTEELKQFIAYEQGFQLSVLQNASPVALDIRKPPIHVVRKIALSRPFNGRHLKDWYRDLQQHEQRELIRQLRMGLVESETLPQIVKRVDHVLDIKRRHVEAIVRTAINHTANAVRTETANSNSHLLKGVKIVATLDTRTSPICRYQDNKVYPVDRGPRPPFHIGCRTTFTYVLKSWKALGVDLKDAPAGTRASMNGQVPDDIAYYDWLKNESVKGRDIAVIVLGKRRAKLFLEGKLPGAKFQNRTGQLFTLDELKKRESQAWKRAFNQ